MEERRFIRLNLPDENGKPVAVRLLIPQIRELIAGLLKTAADMPLAPALTEDIPADDEPIKATAIGISPLSEHYVRLSICAGPIDLQFSISADDLYEVLQTLEGMSEPDPTSSRRPS